MVRLGRLERPLDALSTHSLCRLGYRRVEDQGGFEPPTGLHHGIKSPVRSAATVTGPYQESVISASSFKILITDY